MALDLSGFTTPADDFRGLYKVGDDMKQERRYQQQLAQQKRAQGAASAKFLTDYLDPKDHLTGSPYDPEVVKGFQDLLQEGMKLAAEGADTPMLMMALAPKVGRLNEYSQKAKLLSEQGKQFQSMIKGIKGIDAEKAMSAYKDAAFYDTDPKTGQKKLRDISQIDVDKNYADEVMRNGDIYNSQGIDEWMKGLKQNKVVSDVRLYDSKGNLRRTKAELSAPGIFVPETDARGAHTGFVPEYQVATDDGNPIIHEFQTEKGGVKAPVRMVTDGVFNSLPTEAKAYLLQETRKYSKLHGQDPSSKQAENFAKVLAYDYLKDSGKYASTISELTDNKPSAIQLKINNGIPLYKQGNGSGPNGEITVNDVYGDIDAAVKKAEGKHEPYAGINELPTQAQDVVLDGVSKSLGFRPSLGDLQLGRDGNGALVVKAHRNIVNPNTLETVVKAGSHIRVLNKVGVNFSKQAGAKEKRAVIKEGNTQPEQTATKFKNVPTGGF